MKGKWVNNAQKKKKKKVGKKKIGQSEIAIWWASREN